MGCFTAKTKYSMAPWLKGPTTAISGKVSSMVDKKFEPFTGDLTAGMTGTQTDALQKLKDMLSNGSMNPMRVIDDVPGASGGPAGSTKDYMDPFLDEVLAPVLRNINTSRMQSNMDADAAANMAGAFGDTGHAIQKAENNERAGLATGDATSRAYSDAYRTAMGLKESDINRKMDSQGQVANLLQTIFGAGTLEQETEQKELDARLAEFLREQGFDVDMLAKLSSILGGLSGGTATTEPSTAGSVLGAASGVGSILAAL